MTKKFGSTFNCKKINDKYSFYLTLASLSLDHKIGVGYRTYLQYPYRLTGGGSRGRLISSAPVMFSSPVPSCLERSKLFFYLEQRLLFPLLFLLICVNVSIGETLTLTL